MDLNKVLLTGTIGEPGLTYLASGKPELRLSLTVEQGDGFRLYVQVYVYGKRAEDLAETLEAGDRVIIDGKLSWRSTMKAGLKESKMVVTCYGVDRLEESAQEPRSSPPAMSDTTPTKIVSPEGEMPVGPPMFDAPTPRRRPYPKSALSGGFDS